jgi:two-component system response regulator MprA
MESALSTFIPGRILITDDDPAVRDLLATVVRRTGLQVTCATDGFEALQRIGSETVDLVLLDLMMPRMNGYDVVRELSTMRDRPAVVVLTANMRADDRDLDGNVVQCIMRKPFDLEMLVSVITALATQVYTARATQCWAPLPPARELQI